VCLCDELLAGVGLVHTRTDGEHEASAKYASNVSSKRAEPCTEPTHRFSKRMRIDSHLLQRTREVVERHDSSGSSREGGQ